MNKDNIILLAAFCIIMVIILFLREKNNKNKIKTSNTTSNNEGLKERYISNELMNNCISYNTEVYNISNPYLQTEFNDIYKAISDIFKQEANYYNNCCCPNCGVIYDKPITTTKICKHCGKKIIKRNNYLTKENYLLTEKSFIEFEKYQESIEQLRFYEQKFKTLGYIESNLRKYIDEARLKRIGSERDLLWNVCNTLSSNYVQCGYTFLKRGIKHNGDFDEIQKARICFSKELVVQRLMIEVAEHNGRTNVVNSMFPKYIYFKINTNLLENGFAFNYISDSILETSVDIYEIQEYMKKYNLNIKEFEKQYKINGRGFAIPAISTENSWDLIERELFRNWKF